jgi:ribonuclease R
MKHMLHGRQSAHRDERPKRMSYRSASLPEVAAVLEALEQQPQGATASQLANAMGRTGETRELGTVLKRMVDQGLVLEIRPGRYQVSGSNGEHAAVLATADDGTLIARFPDQSERPVHPRHRLGAQSGDVVQILEGEDGLGLVTRILRRAGREIVGLVNFRPGGLVMVPDNRREGELPVLSFFPGFNDRYQAGDRVVGTVAIGPDGSPGVHLTRILGPESPEIEDFRHVCLLHDLPGDHPPEVEAEARAFADEFPLGTHREDLRQELIFTIDPATAKDFDDAISLKELPDGGVELGVHIADVSNYVRENTALDEEAAVRATSIYLINRVIPMLPEVLSNGLCSLKPDVDRYCLSAFLTLDRQCRLTGTRVAQTLIRSRKRLTYEQALAVLENREPDTDVDDVVRGVLKRVSGIAQRLRKEREKKGALNLFSVEHRFGLDINGEPIEVAQEVSDISHQLIEECMLLANRAVAAWLIDRGMPCVNRVHEAPDEERIAQFARYLEVYGLDSSRIQNRFGLQKLLEDLKKEPPAARLVLNFLLLRSFKKAVYSVDPMGHYALAFEHYCHFTSPIRRYPDLLVHRLVKRALGVPGFEEVETRRGYLDALARQSSNQELRAEAAERDLHARKSARYLAARLGEVFPAIVTNATGGGLTVQLMETGMEGFLPLRELKDDYYVYDGERLALVGRNSGRVISIGTELDAQIVAVDIMKADVILGLDQGRIGRSPGKRTASVEADSIAITPVTTRFTNETVEHVPASSVSSRKKAKMEVNPAIAAGAKKALKKALGSKSAKPGKATKSAKTEKPSKATKATKGTKTFTKPAAPAPTQDELRVIREHKKIDKAERVAKRAAKVEARKARREARKKNDDEGR